MANEWDIFYLGLAQYMSRRSKDPSTKTGAAIVRPDKSLCSVGFNGFPQNMPDTPELYADREEKYSRIVHCEVNAQLFSRDSSLRGYTLYTWPFASCDRCAVQMLQAGIGRFVWPEPDADKLARWGTAFDRTKRYLGEAGVSFSEILMADITKGLAQMENHGS
jgi:dCMP deaminase